MNKVDSPTKRRGGRGWLLAVFAVVVVAVSIFLGRPMTLEEDAQPYYSRPVVPEIVGATTVGQSFEANYPGLNQVAFLVGTNGRVNTPPVTFELRDAATQQVLERTTIDPARLSDNHYLTVQFEPIAASAGNAYLAWFAAPTAAPGQGITIWANPQLSLAQGRAYVGANPVGAELTFRLSYRLTGYQLLATLVNRLAAGKPGLWGWPGTYLGLAVLYLGSIVIVIRWSLLAGPERQS